MKNKEQTQNLKNQNNETQEEYDDRILKKTTGTNKNNIENQEQRTREHRTQEQITKDKHKINEHNQEQRKQNKFNQQNQRAHKKHHNKEQYHMISTNMLDKQHEQPP